LEITESLLLRDDEMVLEILHALRALGVRIAMDDFGTGYSSLSYLRRFPFDKIKIDQSFVRGMMEEEDCAAIVRSVVSLGRSLGMSVNAEGVETLAQFQALRDQGCAELQGYLFSRPRPADDVRSMLDCFQNAVPAAHMGSSVGTSFLQSPSNIASVPLKDSCGFGKEHAVLGEHTQDKFSAAESDILPQSALS
jgi:predicted signal transduction protein with EAL and GGDEF domain